MSAWLQGNKSILNTKKTHVILFKTRNKKTREALKIQISDTEIEQVNWTKLLGIKIDSNLTWKQWITYINQKISKISGIFCKARHYISLKILQILYFALVYIPQFTQWESYLSNCLPINVRTTKENTEKNYKNYYFLRISRSYCSSFQKTRNPSFRWDI